MAKMSKTTSARIAKLINERAAYHSMVVSANEATPWDGGRVRRAMKWHNEATEELNAILGSDLSTFKIIEIKDVA